MVNFILYIVSTISRRTRVLTSDTVRMRLASIGVVLIAWTILAAMVPRQQVPGVVELAVVFGDVTSDIGRYSLLDQYSITLQRIFLSFVLTILVGVPLGVLMGLSVQVKRFAYVYIVILFAVPSIVWAFVISIWFGVTTYLVPVSVCFVITFPYVATILWKAMDGLDPDLLDMADSFNAGRRLRWRYVVLPHLIPDLLTATRTSLSVIWKVVLVAELFATQSGLGYVIHAYFLSLRNDMVITWTLPMFILMFLIEQALRVVESKALYWRRGSMKDTISDIQR